MTLIILMYAIASSSFAISKMLLKYSPPIFLTGARMFFGGVILLAYQYFWAREGFRLQWKHWYLYIQMIFFGIYITYILRFQALQSLTAAKTSFMYNLAPFLSALYSYLLLKEKMTHRQWLGLSIGCVGFIPILVGTSPGEASYREILFISLPELIVLFSVAAHSYSWIVMRKMVKYKDYSPMMVNGLSMTVGGLMAFITSFFVEGSWYPVTNTVPFFKWLALTIVVSNIIFYNMYGTLLKRYSATFLSFAGFTGPLFAALYGWAFLKESVTWYFWASNIIVFFGLYIFYKDELKVQPC